MADDTPLAVAKYGPGTGLLLLLVFAVLTVGLAMFDLVPRTAPILVFAVGVLPLGLLILYQGAYILRNPQLAIEEEIEPPSKYDTSYETERGAKKIGALATVAGFLALCMGAAIGGGLLLT